MSRPFTRPQPASTPPSCRSWRPALSTQGRCSVPNVHHAILRNEQPWPCRPERGMKMACASPSGYFPVFSEELGCPSCLPYDSTEMTNQTQLPDPRPAGNSAETKPEPASHHAQHILPKRSQNPLPITHAIVRRNKPDAAPPAPRKMRYEVPSPVMSLQLQNEASAALRRQLPAAKRTPATHPAAAVGPCPTHSVGTPRSRRPRTKRTAQAAPAIPEKRIKAKPHVYRVRKTAKRSGTSQAAAVAPRAATRLRHEQDEDPQCQAPPPAQSQVRDAIPRTAKRSGRPIATAVAPHAATRLRHEQDRDPQCQAPTAVAGPATQPLPPSSEFDVVTLRCYDKV